MLDLTSPIWKTLGAAGNDADKWLRHLIEEDGSFRENVDILTEDLSHQLSWYSATAYVLPHLVALCPTLTLPDEIYLIAKTGPAIAAEAEWPLSPDSDACLEFQEGITGLRHEIRLLLANPETAVQLKSDPELCQEFSLSALSIMGSRSHAYGLYLLSAYCWESGHAACACGWNDEELPLSEHPVCLEPVSIARWDGRSLDSEPVWLSGLLSLTDDKELRPVLPYVYGTGVCPKCGRREPYWTWHNRFMKEY
ncbi:MAG: hypothetical protein K2O18_11310 [Oscillospiraceae bacterium]|nr:hypothetical protein [Oscillospiraceae bacterium]